MRALVDSVEAEFRRYKKLAEGALAQLTDSELDATASAADNSVAVIVQHLSGNLRSRFTDFLSSDGEKPWRDREGEFARRSVSRAELDEKWNDGWRILLASLAALDDGHLNKLVTIRGVLLSVLEALLRSLAHTSYHVGQIVFLAKELRGGQWRYLTIPPGGSAAYNQNPDREKPPEPSR